MLFGNVCGLSLNRGRWKHGPPQREPLNQLLQLSGKVVRAGILSAATHESREAILAILADPTLRGAQGDAGVPGDPGERHLIFEVRPERGEARECQGTLCLGQRGQGGASDSIP